MISRNAFRLLTAAGVVAAIAACKPSSTVGSPATTSTPASAATPASTMPAGVTAAAIAEGKTLLEAPANRCTNCHGPEGKGGTRGPNLVDSLWTQVDGSYPEIARIINEGVPAPKLKGSYTIPMPPKGRAALTDAQVNSIAAYLWSVSHTR